ncbi:helix-turn-helix domain-containing protein [Methylobacterium sp. JK268]
MPPVPKPKRERRPNFLRQWRKHRGYSLAEVSAEIGMTGPNLGRVEKGEVPYSQDLLEQLAEFYNCEISDLLVRDPSDPEGIWSIWDQAKPAEREQIVKVAKALVSSSTNEQTLTPKLPRRQGQVQLQRTSAQRRTGRAG